MGIAFEFVRSAQAGLVGFLGSCLDKKSALMCFGKLHASSSVRLGVVEKIGYRLDFRLLSVMNLLKAEEILKYHT